MLGCEGECVGKQNNRNSPSLTGTSHTSPAPAAHGARTHLPLALPLQRPANGLNLTLCLESLGGGHGLRLRSEAIQRGLQFLRTLPRHCRLLRRRSSRSGRRLRLLLFEGCPLRVQVALKLAQPAELCLGLSLSRLSVGFWLRRRRKVARRGKRHRRGCGRGLWRRGCAGGGAIGGRGPQHAHLDLELGHPTPQAVLLLFPLTCCAGACASSCRVAATNGSTTTSAGQKFLQLTNASTQRAHLLCCCGCCCSS
jgi:hypothetical protein